MTPSREIANRSTSSIVEFCRFARSNGLPVAMQQTLAAMEALQTVGGATGGQFFDILRVALCSSREDWEKFAALFDAFWVSEGAQHSERKNLSRTAVTRSTSSNSGVLIGLDHDDISPGDSEGKLVSGASTQQRLKRADFSEVSRAEMPELDRLALRLLRQMSIRLSRRMKVDARGNVVDIRRSIRRNVTRGGDVLTLAYKGRKPQRKRLVILLDVSGSMNLYSLFLVRFAFALQKHFKRVDTFLFSTGIVEVSDVLRTPNLSKALNDLSQRVTEWSGGTRIGTSLREFNRGAGRRILSRNTYFTILSDGWDTGDPEILVAELRKIRSRVSKLLWLNPLLGLRDYQPINGAMSAALPFVDVFAPAHNLESLLALERYL
jgi:uncharacterized protein with von Willebrand factor type A (vWA) domain